MQIKRYGNGPRTFFGLHGWSGDHRTFEPLVADVPEDATLHSADLPGCGASPAPKTWTIAAVADEIAEAIVALGRPVTLIGNCTGANIGFFVAERIPARIERMVTIDAFAFWPWYFSVFLNPVFGRYAYFTTFENPIGRWITNLSLRSKRNGDTSLTEGFERVNHRVTYRYLEMLYRAGTLEQFRGLPIPIDVTFGEKSFGGVRESAKRFAQLWPRAQVISLAGAGHLPIREATAVLRDIIFSPQSPDRDIKDAECPRLSTSYAS
jgi:pimeloyl-ACP methyl ester carboxylesterase